MINNNEIQIFNFENNEIRTKIIDNEPYFNLTDACKILEIQNTRNAKARLNEDGVRTMDTIDRLGRTQQANFISEPNLYKLIFQSRKPEAEKFADWVTSEVLPTIRKHGAYMTEQKIEEALLNPDTLITLAKQLKAEKEQRLLAQKQVEEMTPKAVFHDAVANAENTMLVRDVAHFLRQNGLDIGGTRFFVWLRLNGFLTKNNQPTQLSLERGYFKVKETVVHTNHGFQTKTTPKITGRGQTFFLKKMLKEQEEMKEMGL